MRETLQTTEVFTPTTKAIHTFVERGERTNRKLEQALRQPGMQIVMYGPSGTGKTTLLHHKLMQLGPSAITCHCIQTTKFDDLVRNAILRLKPFYNSATTTSTGCSISAVVAAEYLGWAAKLEITSTNTSTSTMNPRVAIPTAEELGRFLGEASCVLVIEDAHKLIPEEKVKVAQTMKLFMDLAADYPEVRMIALGARETASEILLLDAEMNHRVIEIEVEPMNQSELMTILRKGEKALNVSFPESVATQIADYSNGLAAVTHQLALNMCLEQQIIETVPSHYNTPPFTQPILKSALEVFLEDQGAGMVDSFAKASRVDRKGKWDNYRIIMEALAYAPPEGHTLAALHGVIVRTFPKYPRPNLNGCLKRLINDPSKGGTVCFEPNSRRYRFVEMRFAAYCRMRFARARWADYLVFEATYAKPNLLELVAVRRDEGRQVAPGAFGWSRAELVAGLVKGTTFMTVRAIEVDGRSLIVRGERLVLFEVSGTHYINVTGKREARDSLGRHQAYLEAEA